MVENSDQRKRVESLETWFNNLVIHHHKFYNVIGLMAVRLEFSRCEAKKKKALGEGIDALKRQYELLLRKLRWVYIKIKVSVEREDLEVLKSEYLQEWSSLEPENEVGRSNTDLYDQFKKVDQDSDLKKKKNKKKKKKNGNRVVLGCSSDNLEKEVGDGEQEVNHLEQELGVLENEVRNLGERVGDLEQQVGVLEHGASPSDYVQVWERMVGLAADRRAQLDDMKDMLSLTKGMVENLKMLGSSSSPQDVNSRGTHKTIAMLDLIEQLGRGLQETGESGSRRIVVFLDDIMQLLAGDDDIGQKNMALKVPFGRVEADLENLERFLQDEFKGSKDELKHIGRGISTLSKVKQDHLRECDEIVREMGSIVNELKGTAFVFGTEHESVIQTYFQEMKEMVQTFLSLKLEKEGMEKGKDK